jgi:hypothetical protein
MSQAAELYLAIIAFAVVVMAFVQVGAIVAGFRLAKRVDQLARQVEQDIKPLIANVTAMSHEAARAASMAARGVERVELMFDEMAGRVDQTLLAAQDFVAGPARTGMAIIHGMQAVLTAFRGIREASRRRHAMRTGIDEEESLFIG